MDPTAIWKSAGSYPHPTVCLAYMCFTRVASSSKFFRQFAGLIGCQQAVDVPLPLATVCILAAIDMCVESEQADVQRQGKQRSIADKRQVRQQLLCLQGQQLAVTAAHFEMKYLKVVADDKKSYSGHKYSTVNGKQVRLRSTTVLTSQYSITCSESEPDASYFASSDPGERPVLSFLPGACTQKDRLVSSAVQSTSGMSAEQCEKSAEGVYCCNAAGLISGQSHKWCFSV